MGVDFSSNRELWRVEIGKNWTHAPVFDDGQIFLRTWENPASIYSIDTSTGKINWILSQEILSNLYVENDKIYLINSDSFLVTIDRYTGSEVSKVEITPSFNLNKQVSSYFVSGDPSQDILVISFGDNTQIMGLRILNP
jgi:outer membrane protein assembly factor BamB